MVRSRWTHALIAASGAALLAGCGAKAPAAAPARSAPVSFALQAGLPVTWYLPVVPGSEATLANAQASAQLFQPLIWIGQGYTVDRADSLAQSVSWNAAGTEYRITLKPWRWSDGRPVTARDVLFTWSVLQAASSAAAKAPPAPWPDSGDGTGGVPQNVASVTADGPRTVVIRLKQAVNPEWFLYNGIAQFVPMPAAELDRYPHDPTRELRYLAQVGKNPPAVVDGAFRLTEAVPDQRWVMVPNPKFPGPKPGLSQLTLLYEASDTAAAVALKTGAATWGVLPPAYATAAKGVQAPTAPLGFRGVWLNWRAPGIGKAFADPVVRQALQEAIDEPAIVRTVYHGAAAPDYGPVPAIPSPLVNPALRHPVYPYDPAQAAAALTRDGWTLQGSVRVKAGQPLRFTLLYPASSHADQQVAEILQQAWARIGVQVTLTPEPLSTIIGTMSREPSGWAAVAELGLTYGGNWPTGESLFLPGAPFDFGGVDIPQLDAAVRATLAPGATVSTLQAYEMTAAQTLPVLWLPQPGGVVVHDPRLHGVSRAWVGLTGLWLGDRLSLTP
ncbi:MAG: peptide ABC transporter substrate-binding protein [Actinomycetia bacterium]|nr:peptide ABC transporter substrate-binding protein [Actinomycetes bacterium]